MPKLAKGRSQDKSAPLSDEEFQLFRSVLYRVNWVAHQTRPDAAGPVSILASRLHRATVHDWQCLSKLVYHLRSTAQQPLVLHKFRSQDMVFIAASDAGGVDGKPISQEGSAEEDTVQGAWIILASDAIPSASRPSRVSILSWRSAKLKRRVSSTLAGEALAFSQALGELEWLQVMFRDILFGDVNRSDWRSSISPFLAVLREDCELKGRLKQCSVTDAKSLYDSLHKQNPSSRQDRRTSVELAIILEAMQKASSALRWTPHPKMVADGLTKDDISRTNGALEELLKSSKFRLWEESKELESRKSNPANKSRSKRASFKIRNESMPLTEIQINNNLGELFQFSTFDHTQVVFCD